jgi:hypothetical protein
MQNFVSRTIVHRRLLSFNRFPSLDASTWFTFPSPLQFGERHSPSPFLSLRLSFSPPYSFLPLRSSSSHCLRRPLRLNASYWMLIARLSRLLRHSARRRLVPAEQPVGARVLRLPTTTRGWPAPPPPAPSTAPPPRPPTTQVIINTFFPFHSSHQEINAFDRLRVTAHSILGSGSCVFTGRRALSISSSAIYTRVLAFNNLTSFSQRALRLLAAPTQRAGGSEPADQPLPFDGLHASSRLQPSVVVGVRPTSGRHHPAVWKRPWTGIRHPVGLLQWHRVVQAQRHAQPLQRRVPWVAARGLVHGFVRRCGRRSSRVHGCHVNCRCRYHIYVARFVSSPCLTYDFSLHSFTMQPPPSPPLSCKRNHYYVSSELRLRKLELLAHIVLHFVLITMMSVFVGSRRLPTYSSKYIHT